MLKEITGKKLEVKFSPDRHGDLRYFICDIGKAQKNLSWSPRVMPREGIERLVEWIDQNRAIFTVKK